MRLPLYVLAVSGGALVQCTVVPAVGVGGIVPDVSLVLTVLLALRYGAEAGCLTGFALGLAKHGKVRPVPVPHVAKDVGEARALYNLVKEQGRDGAAGIVQGEKGLAYIEFAEAQSREEEETDK